MNKRERATLFRKSLLTAMDTAGIKQAQLADKAHIDRSTLAQLLKEGEPRLPNAHTIAEIATVLGVSTDWLLGLTQEAQSVTTFLDGALNFEPTNDRAPMDSNLEQWHQEAVGYKIRHVPTTLPDLMKTQDILHHEYQHFSVKTGGQAITERDDRQDYARLPDTDMEICIPVQSLEQFRIGGDIWQGVPAELRQHQLNYMADLLDELYPGLRMYGFDAKTHYSVPLGIFGHMRAAIYIGQGYFVLNTRGHIRQLSRHFDALIRNATVQASDMSHYIRGLKVSC